MLDNSEMESINKGWKVITVIWFAMFATLLIYVVLSHVMVDEVSIRLGESFPLDTVKYALLGAAAIELALAAFIRKSMLASPPPRQSSTPEPAVGKYLSSLLITLAMAESVGIVGLVFFFLSKDFNTLYLFVFISAAAMIYFKPKKEELVRLASDMKGKRRDQ